MLLVSACLIARLSSRRHSTEEVKRALEAAEQGLQSLVDRELEVARPALSKVAMNTARAIPRPPDPAEVGLHLAPGAVSNRTSGSGFAAGRSVREMFPQDV
jgi:hypothetical protein